MERERERERERGREREREREQERKRGRHMNVGTTCANFIPENANFAPQVTQNFSAKHIFRKHLPT